MSKKQRKQQWNHTAEGLLQQLVSLSQMKGRVISRRAVKKDPFLDYDEVIALLGKSGGWPAVEAKIRERLGMLEPSLAEPEEKTAYEVMPEIPVVKRKRRGYTMRLL